MQQQNGLRRELGFIHAFSIVVGCVIGSGVFLKPGVVLGYTGDSTIALLAWLFGGIITIASGLTIAELAVKIPKTGGLYTYIEEVYGSTLGFLSGWMQTVIYGPALIGALGLYFGSLLVHFFSWPESWQTVVGIITVLFLTGMNLLGARFGGWIQTLTTFGKLIPVFLITVFGLWYGDSQVLNVLFKSSQEFSFSSAVLATLFAYDGWILVGSVAGEVKNPAKVLPRAITAGLLLIMAAYMLINIAILHVLPADQVVSLGENAAGTASTILFGDFGGKLLSIGILVSIFGSLNGKILSMPRVPYAMATRKQLPFSSVFAYVSKRFGTPVNSIFLITGIGIIFMCVLDSNRLSDIATFSIFTFYIFALVAVFRLRKGSEMKPGEYRVPWYPFIPLVSILGSLFVVFSTLWEKPMDSLLSILLTLVGLPLFWYQGSKEKKKEVSSN
ncbi:APC family permease [Baia soyae]|uniref:Serine/threonine exchange transporter (LAT family) n=1 Tax=Baia soyae TaxID=1544746 RepID=A0A4R2RXR8_9BACL|nr:amino acid permease [Baia soyae]TCP68343.1 serine/threonine exchange transporter (LAT family) [Baia soyae]